MPRLFDATITPLALFDATLVPLGLFDEWLVDGAGARELRGLVRSCYRQAGISLSESVRWGRSLSDMRQAGIGWSEATRRGLCSSGPTIGGENHA